MDNLRSQKLAACDERTDQYAQDAVRIDVLACEQQVGNAGFMGDMAACPGLDAAGNPVEGPAFGTCIILIGERGRSVEGVELLPQSRKILLDDIQKLLGFLVFEGFVIFSAMAVPNHGASSSMDM